MADPRDEGAVRARAYQLWEESGRADGSQEAHWRQAEREIAERGRGGEARHETGGATPAGNAPQAPAGRHVDGMSRHPSVLDPPPER